MMSRLKSKSSSKKILNSNKNNSSYRIAKPPLKRRLAALRKKRLS
jgi:hypothetical protein